MEVVDRYLQAVRFWLPDQQKDDISAELSEDIQTQILEREGELGRSITKQEVEAILQRLGRPVLVATRYLPQEHLIGPVLFPIYRFVIKIVLACLMVPTLLVRIGFLIYSDSYRSAHPWPVALASIWGSLWLTALIAVGTVTIVFAALERANIRTRFLEDWDPRRLPRLRNANAIPRSGTSIELAVNLAWMIFFATNLYSPVVTFHQGLQMSLSPDWSYAFWGFLILSVTTTCQAAVSLWRPYWTVTRATIRLFTDCAGSSLFCWLLLAHVIVGFSISGISPVRAGELVAATNTWMARLLPWAVLVGVVTAVVDVLRILRVRKAALRGQA